MPECIFCEGDGPDLPSDCEICPECGTPPFSGMMFDPKRKEEAERLEQEGNLVEAYSILNDEWKVHTDHDYFDVEMAEKIEMWIENLFESHPVMVEQKVEFCLEKMSLLHFHGAHNEGLEAAEKAMKIARDANRPDLELHALEMHGSIQSQRCGGIENMPQYEDFSNYKKEIEGRIEDS